MRRWRAGTVYLVVIGLALVTTTVAVAQGTLSAVCTSGGQSGPCSSSGWYWNPVTVVWQASTPPSNMLDGCLLGVATTYSTDQITNMSCGAKWSDGSSGSWEVPLHVEISSPTVTATASRAPDSDGWYNHPLAVQFHGSSFSGIASCTSAAYSGPASPSATVTGSCVDNAGKTTTASFSFPYDAAGPNLSVDAEPGAENVILGWSASGDVAPLASIRVERTPGLKNAHPSTVYSGTGASYTDTRVKDGVRYTYTITARDQAGNTAVRTIKVTPDPHLLAPAARALLTGPPVLSWTPVPGATYYNVQLYRDGTVLSTWPTKPQLQLSRTWRYEGHRYRLKPGRYRWYVWPGFGRRTADRYGHEIGRGTFVVS